MAKLAGVPAEILGRAREILKNLESMEVDEGGHPALARGRRRREGAPRAQLGLFGPAVEPDPAAEKLRAALEALDLDTLRPLDALNLLAEWKRKLQG